MVRSFRLYVTTALLGISPIGLWAQQNVIHVNTAQEPVAKGKYEASWNSLQQYEAPEWFQNAKFGIWAHWGPQCQAGQGDWYARGMYHEGSRQYDWHVENYGHPSEAGFKEVIHSWKTEKWNPDELMALYKRAGAQYFFALANHHDNMDLWDSPYQEWNAVNVGPKTDILARWARAAKEQDLPLGLSVHAAHAWSWYETAQQADKKGPYAGVPYDGTLTIEDGVGTWWEGLDPQQLYAQNHALSKGSEDIGKIHSQWEWSNGASIPSQEYVDQFYNRTVDMINRFEPDLLYFDDTALPLYPVSDAGLQIAAHFYNSNMARNNGKLDAVLFGKILNDEQKKALVWDVERGAPDKIQDLPWQTCTCIGDWHYNDDVYEKDRYKSSKDVVQMLIDVVSKNGNLLLNIPMRGDGSIDEKERAIVEGIADWMEIHGESIFGTRPWVVFGEGPSADSSNPINAQGFNEGKVKYTGKDIRFNYKEFDKELFVSLLGQPENDINITRLAEGEGVHTIKDIQLLGSTETLQWKRNKAGLHITKLTVTPNDIAFVFKISYGE